MNPSIPTPPSETTTPERAQRLLDLLRRVPVNLFHQGFDPSDVKKPHPDWCAGCVLKREIEHELASPLSESGAQGRADKAATEEVCTHCGFPEMAHPLSYCLFFQGAVSLKPSEPVSPQPQPKCKHCGLPIRETHMGRWRNEWEHVSTKMSYCANHNEVAWPVSDSPSPVREPQEESGATEGKTKQREIDISNLRFYASMFREQKWQTEGGGLHWTVYAHTLDEIAARLAASLKPKPTGAQEEKQIAPAVSEERDGNREAGELPPLDVTNEEAISAQLRGKYLNAVTERQERLCRERQLRAALARLAALLKPSQPSAPRPEDGVALIQAERRRQVAVEGWTPEHDDEHDGGALAMAAACYVRITKHQWVLGNNEGMVEYRLPADWPREWGPEWWKPSKAPIRNLVKAGALIAAEIDRLQRLSSPLRPLRKRGEVR